MKSRHNICLRSTKRVKEESGIEEPLRDDSGGEVREDINSKEVIEESKECENAGNITKPLVEKESEGRDVLIVAVHRNILAIL